MASDAKIKHAEPALLRLRQYAEDALKVTAPAPPWHRGILAVATILLAIGVGLLFHGREALDVAPALSLQMTLADTEGPLGIRLRMLLYAMIGIGIGGLAAILLGGDSLGLLLLLLCFAVLAGVGSIIGPPYQQATRFAVVVSLLLSVIYGVTTGVFLEILAATGALAALGRALESWIAPDRRVGEFKSLKEAVFVIRTARPYILRFVVCYVLTGAAGWIMGRSLDAVHPTWVTVTVLVVMWPDAQRSYQRIFQRVVGTLVGAAIVLILIEVIADKLILGVIAALLLYLLPQFIRRNYWLHCGLMVIFVMLALDLWSSSTFSAHLFIERIGDVLAGCALALIGTLAAFWSTQKRIAASQTDSLAPSAAPAGAKPPAT